jgi:hypothetical protein
MPCGWKSRRTRLSFGKAGKKEKDDEHGPVVLRRFNRHVVVWREDEIFL